MIRIIAEGMYDTAHAVFEAHEISRMKPDAVILELPYNPFEGILHDYNSGKLTVKQLKSNLFRALEKEEREVDHNLLDKFLLGEIEEEELEVMETEGREIHVMAAAKKYGAELHAMDMPLEETQKITKKNMRAEDLSPRVHDAIRHNHIPYLVWELSSIIHWPFYVLERLLHHHGIKTTNPYFHNVSKCRVCRFGVLWDRAFHHMLMPILKIAPLSKHLRLDLKIAEVIKKVDWAREEYMANRINEVYQHLKTKLKREPRILVIVHLWSAKTLEKMIKGIE